MLPVVIAAPAAYVSSFHQRAAYAIPACAEIPHPDDDYLEVWVNSITGGPNEFSPVVQANFTVPQSPPWRRLEFVPYLTRGEQPRPLVRPHRSPSKMRGR